MHNLKSSMLRLSKNTFFHYVAIFLLGAALFVPFLGAVHLFDWDEANFAESSREMIESGNYMRVTVAYQPFWEKPPLFFWLQTFSMKAFGVNEFAARFVDALTGILTLLVVYTIGRKLYSRRFGLLWVLAFVGSFLPHLFYKSGIIDPVFNLFIFLGISACTAMILSTSPPKRLALASLAGIAIGLAMLTKGPVALLIFMLTFFVYWASVRFKWFFTLGELSAFVGALAIVAFLFYGVETISHGTWFIREFTKYQIRLLTTGDAGQGRPFYFHFLVILFGCFPASFFALRSFVKRSEAGEEQKKFNKVMIILFWVVLILFSLVKTKTVLYSSLTYFPLTYLAALHMDSMISGKLQWNAWLGNSLAFFAGIVAVIITAFPIFIIHKEWILPLIHDKFAIANLQNPVVWSGYELILGLAFGVALTISLVFIFRKQFSAGFISLFISSALCLDLFLLIFAPKIECYTQGGPIAFYREHSKENVYTRALFKSYADLFYSRIRSNDNPSSRNKEWLLGGPVDKPAYFVAHQGQIKELEKYNLVLLKQEYGFVYYRRDPPVNQFSASDILAHSSSGASEAHSLSLSSVPQSHK